MKAVLYTRVSTDEQADKGFSLKHQIDVLRKYCELKQIEELEHFREDYSAKTFDRPEWLKLEAYCRANRKNVDAVLFTRWDRFSRNHEASLTTIRNFRNIGIDINSIEQPLDLAVPENKMILAIYLCTPEVENDKISIRTKEGIRRSIKDGCYPYSPPFGYIRDFVDGKVSLKPDGQKSEIVRFIFDKYATGNYTQSEIRQMVADRYHVKIYKSSFYRMLKNKVYIGRVKVPRYKKEDAYYVNALHTAIIDDNVFNHVQNILDVKSPKPEIYNTKNNRFPFRGHIVCCNCSQPLTASTSKGRSKRYNYYHCQSPCKTRWPADQVHDAFSIYLKNKEIASDLLPVFKSVIEVTFNEMMALNKNEVTRLKAETTQLQQKVEEAEDRLFEGQLPVDVYNKVKAKHELTINSNQHRINELEGRAKNINESVNNCLMLLSNLSGIFDKSSLKDKKIMLGSIFPEKIDFDGEQISNRSENSIFSIITASISNKSTILTKEKAEQRRKSALVRLRVQNETIIEPQLLDNIIVLGNLYKKLVA